MLLTRLWKLNYLPISFLFAKTWCQITGLTSHSVLLNNHLVSWIRFCLSMYKSLLRLTKNVGPTWKLYLSTSASTFSLVSFSLWWTKGWIHFMASNPVKQSSYLLSHYSNCVYLSLRFYACACGTWPWMNPGSLAFFFLKKHTISYHHAPLNHNNLSQ